MAVAGLSPEGFSTGVDHREASRSAVPSWLRYGRRRCICGVGMFNALMMSYTRLPIAMAEDGMLPRVLARRNRHGVPWVSLVVCGFAWALALNLPFERLISIDLVLYGSSLLLEFVALIALRVREPILSGLSSRQPGGCLPARGGPNALIGYAL